MNSRALRIAGTLTMFSAFIAIPLTFLSSYLERGGDQLSQLTLSALQLSGTLLFIAINLFLKRFLNTICAFSLTNSIIDTMITVNSVAGFLTVLFITFPQTRSVAGVIVILLIFCQGILQLFFGYKLQSLNNNLGGLLKPYCIANMLTGLLLASVVFILGGVATSAIADLMLATIFFNTARGVEVTDKAT